MYEVKKKYRVAIECGCGGTINFLNSEEIIYFSKPTLKAECTFCGTEYVQLSGTSPLSKDNGDVVWTTMDYVGSLETK